MEQQPLKNLAIQATQKIANAIQGEHFFTEPFKHAVIDDFFPIEFAELLLNQFPAPEAPVWERTHDEDIEIKLRTHWESEFDVPEGIIDAIRVMNSSYMLKAMSAIFDISKLMPDPYFTGGGLNATVRNGLLDVHVDGNYHDASGLNRRINAILYLNPGWQEGWGGEIGFYDATGENLVKKIPPIHNRLVIFDTNDFSFHGLPDPLNFPENRARQSIILYYYTKESRPSDQISIQDPHSALWKKRNFTDKRGNKTRDYQ